ncbi:hypothetical protein KIL84_012277 [Mauremys mutica]|uniref:Uncharacterized protein n=1 Tax=Mauremys mutica TaxID=74926 RepID=A0A9D4B363_9SAUR|nr:hypothetical protein KIL84_012277 [Mauremys mutica]
MDLADNVQKQLIQMAEDLEAFSIALDETIDASDTAQCAVFIRGVDCNLNITEELLDLMPLKGTTTYDIFQGLEWNKLISLASDGAPSVCSENVGVVGLLKTKLNSLSIPGISFTNIHCILHQDALCCKSLQMKEVMDVVVKTVNFIHAQGLNHRQFTSFLASMDSEYGELLYHTEVRWLSHGNVLKLFFALREEIDFFMKMKNKEIPQLADSTFICNLAFLTNVTDHLNAPNLKLQEPHFQLFSTSFAVDIDSVAEEMQMELVELQCDTILKQKYTNVGIPEFYQFLSQERFPMLFSASSMEASVAQLPTQQHEGVFSMLLVSITEA